MPTLYDVLQGGEPAHPAVVVPDGTRLTYAQLENQVEQVALGLAARGVTREDRVAMVLPNGIEAIVCFLGATVVATAAPLNPAYTEEEFRFFLEDTAARVLIVPRGGAEAARRAAGPDRLVLEVEAEHDGSLAL